MPAKPGSIDLAREMAHYVDDPLSFVVEVLKAYPDPVQTEILKAISAEVRARRFDGQNPVMPVLVAMSSGHGTGKSILGGWLTWWILSTRPGSKGTVTAGTFTQLESRTWAAIIATGKQCPTAIWFNIQAQGIYSKTDPEGWYVIAQTARDENAQAFAGQHAANSTSWYLFDEASAVPEKVWEVAKGGLTDGEPMVFAWGQMERNTGQFYEVCFGAQSHRWNVRAVDSRSSRFTNKELLAREIEDYGEDSDFVRVRILGLPPRASELQFIDRGRIEEASKRQVETLEDEPLIVGFDVSGGGAAWNVWRFRRGLDARSIPPIRLTGEQGRDRSVLVGVCAEILRQRFRGREVDMMFVDSAFGAAVCERLIMLGYQDRVMEVNFGAPSRDKHYANQRAIMWATMKDWLPRGAIDNDQKLKHGLGAPGYHLRPQNNALVIESKQDMQERGEASPDDADALALTFAYPVHPRQQEVLHTQYQTDSRNGEYRWMH
jgi:hypothetical protein